MMQSLAELGAVFANKQAVHFFVCDWLLLL